MKISTTIHMAGKLSVLNCIRLQQLACRFRSELSIKSGERAADLKNIFQLLGMPPPEDGKLEIVAEGEDAKRAVLLITDYFFKELGKQ